MSIVLDGTTGITTPGLTNTGTETLVNLTTTGNTILGDASTDTLNVGNGGLIKDASGNLGLGVTPSAWGFSGQSAFQVKNASFAGYLNRAYVGANNYTNSGGSSIYIASDFATNYVQASGQHQWYNAASGTAGNAITFTQAMTLDASGNLLVGKTSSSAGKIQLAGDAASNGSDISLQNTGTSGRTWRIGDGVGGYSGSLVFFDATDSAARALIDSSGNFMVGVTSTGARIAAKNTGYTSTTRTSGEIFVGASNGSGADCTLHFTDSVAYNYYFGGYNGTAYVTTNNSGGVKLSSGATSWAADSDERLKNIKEPITNAVENLCSLRTVYGNYKTDEENVSRLFLIAQDVQKVYPETVDIGQDEEQTLSFRAVDLIPVLVAAIKEQQALIQTLTDRITALENK